jgi:hypothetical protein
MHQKSGPAAKPQSVDQARPSTSANPSTTTGFRNASGEQRLVAWANSIQNDKVRQQQVYQNQQ